MGSILIYKGMPPLTEEQETRLSALAALPDDEIVFDEDCPELTEEQLSQMKRVNQQSSVSKSSRRMSMQAWAR